MRRQQLINYFIGNTVLLMHAMIMPAEQALIALSRSRPNPVSDKKYCASRSLRPLKLNPRVCGRCEKNFLSQDELAQHCNVFLSLEKDRRNGIIHDVAYNALLECRPPKIR